MPEPKTAEQFAAPVPAAVKAGAARAAQIQQEYIKSLNGENPANPEQPGEEAPGEENPPAPPAEQPAPPAAAQPPAPPAPPADDNDASWKHKFESLQGRYKVEVPKLKDQIKTLSQEVTNLNGLLASIPRTEALKPAAQPQKSLIKEEELQEYGPEFFEMMNRVVKEATQPYVTEIEQLKSQLGNFNTRIASQGKATVLQQLDANIKNWREINESDEFLTWLRLPDVYSGVIRHEMLKAAFERNDYPRVAAFFEGFLAELAATEPNEPEPAPAANPPANPLKSFAAPGRAKSTAAPNNAPAEKPFFTTSQIAQFYTEKGLGKWRGREKEAALFERQIFEAQNEGRIR